MSDIVKARHKAMIHTSCPNGGWDYYEVEVGRA